MLVLLRAFKQSTDRCLEQPSRTDIEAAAVAFRDFSKIIHGKIKNLIPVANITKSFQFERVGKDFEEIIATYKVLFVEAKTTIEQGGN